MRSGEICMLHTSYNWLNMLFCTCFCISSDGFSEYSCAFRSRVEMTAVRESQTLAPFLGVVIKYRYLQIFCQFFRFVERVGKFCCISGGELNETYFSTLATDIVYSCKNFTPLLQFFLSGGLGVCQVDWLTYGFDWLNYVSLPRFRVEKIVYAA